MRVTCEGSVVCVLPARVVYSVHFNCEGNVVCVLPVRYMSLPLLKLFFGQWDHRISLP